MQIPKSLLGAMAIGLTIGITSCSKEEIAQTNQCGVEGCIQDHSLSSASAECRFDYNCPACGMG